MSPKEDPVADFDLNGLAAAKEEKTFEPANAEVEVVCLVPVENGDAPVVLEKEEKEGTLGLEEEELVEAGMAAEEGRVGEVVVEGGAEPKGDEAEEGMVRETKGEEEEAKEENPVEMGLGGAGGSLEVDATGCLGRDEDEEGREREEALVRAHIAKTTTVPFSSTDEERNLDVPHPP